MNAQETTTPTPPRPPSWLMAWSWTLGIFCVLLFYGFGRLSEETGGIYKHAHARLPSYFSIALAIGWPSMLAVGLILMAAFVFKDRRMSQNGAAWCNLIFFVALMLLAIACVGAMRRTWELVL